MLGIVLTIALTILLTVAIVHVHIAGHIIDSSINHRDDHSVEHTANHGVGHSAGCRAKYSDDADHSVLLKHTSGRHDDRTGQNTLTSSRTNTPGLFERKVIRTSFYVSDKPEAIHMGCFSVK